MGGEQAARTMQIVSEAAMARKGLAPDPAQSQAQYDKIVAMFEAQADVFYTSGLVLDDGVIDPRDTRAVLAQCLDICAAGRGAAAQAYAVWRGAHVSRHGKEPETKKCSTRTNTWKSRKPSSASSTPKSTRTSMNGKRPKYSPRTRSSKSSETWACWA
jgi:hypothetical protein